MPMDRGFWLGLSAVIGSKKQLHFSLTTVALAASCIPALRAMRLEPITTLHAE